MKFFFFKNNKELPRAAQDELLPRKAFFERGRERFLAAFDASPLAADVRAAGVHDAVAPAVRRSRAAMFAKFAVGIAAVLCVATGFSVYADTANVPVTSPLYPWKRLGENVQLALTVSAAKKAQLQATFAVRRAEEIQQLTASHPSSTLIPQLTEQLDGDISSSLSVIPPITNESGKGPSREHGVGAGIGVNASTSASSTIGAGSFGREEASSAAASASEMTPPSQISPEHGAERGNSSAADLMRVYCAAFDANVSDLFIGHLEAGLAAHPGAFAAFNQLCGGQNAASGASAASGTPTSTVASTTLPPPILRPTQPESRFPARQEQQQNEQSSQGSGGGNSSSGIDASAGGNVIIATSTSSSADTNINENVNTGNGNGGGEQHYYWSDGSSSADVTVSASGTNASSSGSVRLGR